MAEALMRISTPRTIVANACTNVEAGLHAKPRLASSFSNVLDSLAR